MTGITKKQFFRFAVKNGEKGSKEFAHLQHFAKIAVQPCENLFRLGAFRNVFLKSHFKLEFLNRIDEIVIFNRLSKDNLKQIVEIQMEHLRERLSEKNITIILTDNLKSYLSEKGFDPTYGARPLKRLIQREIENKLAMKILDGDIHEDSQITIDYQNGEVLFDY